MLLSNGTLDHGTPVTTLTKVLVVAKLYHELVVDLCDARDAKAWGLWMFQNLVCS